MRSPLIVAFILATGLNAAAQEPQIPEFERRLVPITVDDTPGAFGTRWKTRLYGLDEAGGVLVFGLNYIGPVLPGSGGVPWTGPLFSTRTDEPPGGIVYVPATAAGAVHLTTVLRQTGSGANDQLHIPVVPESAFSAGTLYFLGLENSADERSHLRVYSLDIDKPAVAVRLRVLVHHQQQGWIAGHDSIMDLDVRQQTSLWPYWAPLPVRPWARQVDLTPLLKATGFPGPYMLLVSPATPDTRIWAFVSETHNETQRSQLVLPH